MRKILFLAMAAVFALASCKQTNAQNEAEGLLKKAVKEYETGNFKESLHCIDSLRKIYPNAVDVRTRALKLYQEVCLKQAQKNIETLDAELERTKADYNAKKSLAEAHHNEGTATAEELTAVSRLRLKRDSLQVKFDMECAKVRMIRQKQKEE
ncbi:hypothetical protein [Prevotella sp. OH937_COT-195]|uniref:hypothetical protein n=1 Tax=Prevotella sp. OH937_COT-195 TaxID=2491051 RepID=UPI000F6466CA|nr:hypothetical protein [Prevotella sp. OH937_COT-195]RRD02305.1 hypothetical protein EII32_03555 [Prevotella sp. OH937_COT-195]